jgi:bacillithiol biosynthesis deacetylase BshB1
MVDFKCDILAIGVHPDDVELGCGATVIKHVELGYRVAIVDLTQGELGTRGNANLRMQEAELAKDYAGISHRVNLKLDDGFFENNKDSKIKIIEQIRKFKPDLVLANAVRDRHPDHGNAAKLIYEACFLSGLSKIKTVLDGKEQVNWRPRKLLNYIQDFHIEPDIVVDISHHLEKKFEMIACFKSQFYNPESTEENTPISSPEFLDHLKGRATAHGRRIGVKYGEGFTSEELIGISDLTTIL